MVDSVYSGSYLFRSLSHQLYGLTVRHHDIHSLLVRFENLNSSMFSQILTKINSSDLKSHIHNYYITARGVGAVLM